MNKLTARILVRLLLLLAVVPMSSRALPGDEVVVIYNRREHGSEEIALHYASRRGVPDSQVVGLRMPVTEQISRSQFADEVQKPVAKFLEERRLWSIGPVAMPTTNGAAAENRLMVTESKIRYLVLCRGVPLKIGPEPEPSPPEPSELRPEFRRNEAAVDSELSCLPLLAGSYPTTGLLRNPVYGVTNSALLHPTNGVLMVSRLDAPTVEVAKGLVDKAMQAEQDGFWGRAYFDLRSPSEPGMKQGEDWIRAAAEVCRVLGFETVVDESPSTFRRGFPMSQIAVYAGWYREHVDGPFLDKQVEFMPGALAYHLHSFSAASLRSADRHWVGPLLEKGATLSLGSVHEPYLGGTTDIGVLVARLYYQGMSYGEAAYASQPVCSWMTTVVGDPLYKPFRRDSQELHDELVAQRDPLRAWSQLRIVNLNLAKGVPKYQLVAYLEEIPATKASAVLSEKLGDLYAELGKPSSALRSWQAALDLDPSPQQKIRLQLRLGERLAESGQIPEAMSAFERFVEQNPNHPDLPTVYGKLIPLATQLDMTNQVARYQEAIAKLTGAQQSASSEPTGASDTMSPAKK
ncbi:MAG: TIGR03790 family protein [Verrucomicrobia bacterium]|jgi:uncharacterized protein (TIGR03790 family)|nr:TIGR03790 family protein [Verrucomicrobiota bacterium]